MTSNLIKLKGESFVLYRPQYFVMTYALFLLNIELTSIRPELVIID
jgi:hypothetical protein